MITKTCRHCSTIKHADLFYPDKKSPDKLGYVCKPCCRIYHKQKNNLGKVRRLTCKLCGEPIDKSNLRDDVQYCSLKCGANLRRKKHYDLNPEYYKKERDRHNKDVVKRIFTRIKSRAKLNNIPFNLTLDDFKDIPNVCPVLGIPIKLINAKIWSDISISVDRINPNLGYIKGNIALISNRANRIKYNATLQELEKVTEWLRQRSL